MDGSLNNRCGYRSPAPLLHAERTLEGQLFSEVPCGIRLSLELHLKSRLRLISPPSRPCFHSSLTGFLGLSSLKISLPDLSLPALGLPRHQEPSSVRGGRSPAVQRGGCFSSCAERGRLSNCGAQAFTAVVFLLAELRLQYLWHEGLIPGNTFLICLLAQSMLMICFWENPA